MSAIKINLSYYKQPVGSRVKGQSQTRLVLQIFHTPALSIAHLSTKTTTPYRQATSQLQWHNSCAVLYE